MSPKTRLVKRMRALASPAAAQLRTVGAERGERWGRAVGGAWEKSRNLLRILPCSILPLATQKYLKRRNGMASMVMVIHTACVLSEFIY